MVPFDEKGTDYIKANYWRHWKKIMEKKTRKVSKAGNIENVTYGLVRRRETGKSSTSSCHTMNDMQDNFHVMFDFVGAVDGELLFFFRLEIVVCCVKCVNAQKKCNLFIDIDAISLVCRFMGGHRCSKYNFMQINCALLQKTKISRQRDAMCLLSSSKLHEIFNSAFC